MTPFEYGAAVQIVDALAFLAAVPIQFAALCLAKPVDSLKLSLAVGTFEPLWMNVFPDPVQAGFSVHKVCVWKVHAPYFTRSLVLNMSQAQSVTSERTSRPIYPSPV